MGSFVGDSRTLASERLKKEAMEASDPAGNIRDLELREEWQDDEFPRPLPEETSEEDLEASSSELSPVASNTLELCGRRHMRKRLQAPDLSEGSVKSGDLPESTPDGSLDINLDELETPSESEFQEGRESGHEFEWEDDLPRARRVEANLPEKFCTGRVMDTKDPDGRVWRIFLGDEHERKVDLSAIEPYARVISHGGHYGEGLNAVLVFASCYLPESSVPNYPYIMENLFRYIIGTLELMVAENYMLVCLNGATSRSRFPSFAWIKQCYQTIDRRLRKNLKSLVIVHPTWYIKALMTVFKPFISSKFSQKVRFVESLDELAEIVPCNRSISRPVSSSYINPAAPPEAPKVPDRLDGLWRPSHSTLPLCLAILFQRMRKAVRHASPPSPELWPASPPSEDPRSPPRAPATPSRPESGGGREEWAPPPLRRSAPPLRVPAAPLLGRRVA